MLSSDFPANPACDGRQGRLAYIDGLRGCLSLLVVLDHVAIAYGAVGGWYYYEHAQESWIQLLLTTFVAHNQFYFMGLFFLLAGLFIPASLARKGGAAFLRERLMRLGIPLLAFVLLVSPALGYVYWFYQKQYRGSFGTYLLQVAVKDFSPGPLWFLEALLGFTLIYLLWQRLRPAPSPSPSRFELRVVHVVGFALLLGGLSFLVRLAFPIGRLCFFLQLAYFPQYILMFAVGIAAGSPTVLSRLSRSWLWPSLALALVGAALVPMLVSLNGGIDERFLGGWHWQAAALCLVEGVVCPAACLAMILLFREVIPANRFWQILGTHSYAVYLVHAPLCVLLSLALRTVPLHPLAKAGIVALLGVGLSLVVSEALRRYGGRTVRTIIG
jgi:peptidoglycan/LPS O-acetylase OafA/YrhL